MNAFVRGQLDAGAAVERNSPGWLAQARRAAREDFARRGLPNVRNERWKYTDLRALESRAPQVGDPQAIHRLVDSATVALPGLEGPRLVFVNGVFRADLSHLAALPDGVELSPLADLLGGRAERARDLFAVPHDAQGNALAGLNLALARDGVWLDIAPGVRIETPIHFAFVGVDAGADFAWHLRHGIRLGAGAAATIVEQHWGGDAAPQFGNLFERWTLGEGATLRHIRLQQAGAQATLIQRCEAVLGQGALLEAVALELGAGLARRDLRLTLAGNGARADLCGATVLRGRQHLDAHFELRHGSPGATSDLRWRCIADQRARAVFGGSIVVEPGADGSDAQLSNKNLLLSPHAEIDTRPALEIHADEVKAAHGATVGRLDESALFYLRSRGVPQHLARSMLTFAFVGDVLDTIESKPLRAELCARLRAHLPQITEAGP